ncbi:MAG: T9SS type A sorting domain-containing protein, partial [Candidatus Marinimicrobia bacterium]|nr:T9SS type A sorting domain-containing protein [Candidatus Neomarinimicrobiota bacterium]
PNPFNPITNIEYDLHKDGNVIITIYDLNGHVIKDLINGTQTLGRQSIKWNATNNIGHPVSAGVYIYRVHVDGFSQTKKMVLLK